MKKITVSQLRYHFPDVEAQLRSGEMIQVYRRQRLIARLVPVHPRPAEYPDFSALSRRIFGKRKVPTTGRISYRKIVAKIKF